MSPFKNGQKTILGQDCIILNSGKTSDNITIKYNLL